MRKADRPILGTMATARKKSLSDDEAGLLAGLVKSLIEASGSDATEEALARMLGIHQTTVSKALKRRAVSLEYARRFFRLAQALKLPMVAGHRDLESFFGRAPGIRNPLRPLDDVGDMGNLLILSPSEIRARFKKPNLAAFVELHGDEWPAWVVGMAVFGYFGDDDPRGSGWGERFALAYTKRAPESLGPGDQEPSAGPAIPAPRVALGRPKPS